MKRSTAITAGYSCTQAPPLWFLPRSTIFFYVLQVLAIISSTLLFLFLLLLPVLDCLSFLDWEALTLDSHPALTEENTGTMELCGFLCPAVWEQHLQQLKAFHSLPLTLTTMHWQLYLREDKPSVQAHVLLYKSFFITFILPSFIGLLKKTS